MPIRKRKSKSRPGEAPAWACYMMSGHDFFDELVGVGLSEDAAADLAEETWHRIGNDVLAYLDALHIGYQPYLRPIWAERQFGAPHSGRRRHAS